MDETKARRLISALVLIIIVVFYTIFRMQGGGGQTVSIGVDDSKIGIAVDENPAIFLDFSDIVKVSSVDALSDITLQDYEFFGSEDIDYYIVIETDDGCYVVNSGSKRNTEKIYQDIIDKMGL